MKEIILGWLSNIPFGDNKYVLAVATFIFFILLAFLIQFIIGRFFRRLAKKTKTKFDDLLFKAIKKPIFYILLMAGIKLAANILGAGTTIQNIINSLMAIAVVFLIIRVVDVLIETWGKLIAKRTKTELDEVLLPLFHKIAKVIFVVIALLWILSVWNIDITPYLAGAGIGALVVGLALQDMLKNILGGVTLMIDQTFKIGDKVKLDDGTVGTIHDIGLRSTKLITFDNEVIYVPNGILANSKVQNYTRPNPKVRTHVEFGVEYGSDVKKVQKTVMDTLNKLKGILKDPAPTVQFISMGDSALLFKANFWVENWEDAYGKKLEATELIYNALNKAKIGIPFPTRTIHLQK